MKKSDLQFRNPVLTRIEYEVNKNFSGMDIELDVNVETSINKSEEGAKVEVTINVFNKNTLENSPFYIIVSMEGMFEWSEEADLELIDRLLKTNGPAILTSYMRPYISSLTTGSGFAPLILPLLNFSEQE